MNWKVLCLIPALTLTAVPAYSNTSSNNQATRSDILVAQGSEQGDTMKKPNTMMNDGAMMRHSNMMGMGSRGEEVKAAQSFLEQQGFYTGPINGIFDAPTRAAVVNFQNSKKITPTGIIGPTTRSAMQ